MTFKTTLVDTNGAPIGGMAVIAGDEITGESFPRSTDGNGYADVAMLGSCKVGDRVTLTVFDPQLRYKGFVLGDALVITEADQVLTYTIQSSFSAPARDRVIAVQASFQGLTMPSPAGLIPGFGPFGWSRDLTAAGRSAWRAVERGAGDTHAIRAISAEYKNDAGYSYPISGCDFTQDLVGLKSMIAEEVQSGATAVNLYLAGDGQAYTPDGGCYGWPWIMANQARIVAALRDKTILGFDATRRIIFFHGFELISNGGWSPSNFEQAILALRALGDDLYIGSHIGVYTWWGDAAGAGGPVSDWSGPAGQAIDVCVEEGDAPFVDANTGAPLNNTNCDGWQQRAVAHLPNPNMAIIKPTNIIQREWVTNPLTPRGPRTSIALESDEARWVRGQVTLQEIQFERAYQRQLGWAYVG